METITYDGSRVVGTRRVLVENSVTKYSFAVMFIGGATSAASRSDDSEGEETSALEEELSLNEPDGPARVLAALNALRKARQHYDVLLSAGGEEIAAHRAVLAAASPRLLAALADAPAQLPLDVDADALRELVEYAYTGRLRVRDTPAARRLYATAARLRMESARAHLADRLLRRLAPHDCLAVRALPDLAPPQRALLDQYIAQNFDDICASGALAALPLIRIELLRETSAEGGEEAPAAVADAALAWLRDRHASDISLEELCARTHLLYVDAGGELRDCGELPAARGDAPELQEYRREREQEKAIRKRDRAADDDVKTTHNEAGHAECTVIAARAGGSAVNGGGAGGAGGGASVGGAGVTRAVVVVRGRLAAARVAWRTGNAEGPRGGKLGTRADEPLEPTRLFRREGQNIEAEATSALAHMAVGRCAMGAAALGGRLVVCGGYDRARVLRGAEAYDPKEDRWVPLPDMKRARARFPAARLGDALFVLGGSDGQAELDSVDVLVDGAWSARAALPLACSHAVAGADEERGVLYVAGGWAAGRSLRQVHRYEPASNRWGDAPPLLTGRSQCAGAVWAGALWVLGGCDAWNCLATTEFLPLDGAATWRAGPALPTARRSMGAAAWRGMLVAAGGSAGSASLRDTALLSENAAGGAEGAWRVGPPLRRARAAPALVALGDALYAAGGYSGKQFLACVETLLHPDGEWTTLKNPEVPTAPPAPTAPTENGTQTEKEESQ
ncbi:influenza virus NS1A-binding protein homolog B-like [Aricia agestis]|uniref:influenza virus NS1A-binding protein homolog B-like n=1 Tax=Aricia agestis TaxID=91739 RepID=UPI001C20A17B|nr:influenza virus NS1A-binding protein homolog B-like [Aricia agestis]